MKSLKLILPVLVMAIISVGCSSIKITPSLVESGVTAAVHAGVAKYPTSLPYVKASGELICSAAFSTNISPESIVADLAPIESLKTPEGVLIVQSAISVYTYVYNSYGDQAIEKVPELRGYLQAVCNGINAGTVPPSKNLMLKQASQWPQIP